MQLQSIHPGDIVEVDIRGWCFMARVKMLDNGGLQIRPIDNRVKYHRVSARQVTGIWHAKRDAGQPAEPSRLHADGFGTRDINYIWHDGGATLFAEHEFGEISPDHVVSMSQFNIRARVTRSYPDRTLLRLDPFVVHRAPDIMAPGGERAFVKISLSADRYNLRGNSHNYAFDYSWRMWSRDEIRNDPAYAGGDAGPQDRP